MSGNVRNFIHIGPGKTASTFLQRAVFSQHSEINYLGKVWREDPSLLRALAQVVRADSLTFDLEATRREFHRCMSPGHGKKVNLVSEEDLSAWRFIDAGLCAIRMHQIFGDSRILVTLRHPVDWIESSYFWLLQLGQYDSGLSINDWVLHWLRRPGMGNPLAELRIGKIIEIFQNVFGRESIDVLVYEELSADSASFSVNLAGKLGVDEVEMKRIFADSESGARDKQRLSQLAVDLLIEANTRLKDDPDSLLEWMRAQMLPRLPPKIGTPLSSKLDAYASGPDKDLTQLRELFSEVFSATRRRLPASPPATASLSPNVLRAIQHRCAAQYTWIQDTFSVDLRKHDYPLA